ncbi:MAG: response regulator [Bacteroidota bacterium]
MKLVHKLLLIFLVNAALASGLCYALLFFGGQIETHRLEAAEQRGAELGALDALEAALDTEVLPAEAYARARAALAERRAAVRHAYATEDAAIAQRAGTIRAFITALLGLPFLIALLLGVVLARTLNRRLRRIADGADAIGAGDLDRRLDVRSRDEVGDLARAFNDMADALSRRTVSEAHLSDILDSIADPVGLIDRDGRLTRINDATEEMFGVELGGHSALAFFGGTEEDLAEFWRQMRGEERVVGWETQFRRADGERFPVVVSAAKLRNADGEATGMVFTARDLTEAKRAEATLRKAMRQAEAATQTKSEFLATMSHEIRTPLNGVIGMTGFLLDCDLPDEQREYAEVIRSSGEALLALINDILDFSKIEAGMLDLEEQPFTVATCVEDALDLVAYRAAQQDLELGYLVEDGVPAAVRGDETRLRQVLANLLANAVKFTERGEVTVLVEAVPSPAQVAADEASALPETPATWLRLSVRDTGIGIAPDRVGHLFEEFTQADASTTRQYGGTGLGLAITKRLVEAMGGVIEVESVVGLGSIFRVTLPLEPAAVAGASLCAEIERLRGRHLLVVDDSATNRRILTLQAERWGMHVVAAASGREALRLLHQGTYDLAVLDFHMPEMDGIALAEQIRAVEPALPLVMLSSMSQTPPMRPDLLAAYLNKPIKQAHLCRVLVQALGTEKTGPLATPAVPVATQEAAPLRVLVVEDNAVNQRVVTLMLERLGHRADCVGDGIEALDALHHIPYDVVLMDLRMPRLDGIETTRRLRSDRDGPQPYIIAMTADVTPDKREACLAVGMDDFLGKPVARAALHSALALVPADRRVAPRRSLDGARGDGMASDGIVGDGALATSGLPAVTPSTSPAPEPPPEPLTEAEILARVQALLPTLFTCVEGDPERFLSFLIDFERSAIAQFADLREALDEGEARVAARAAHSLKSSAAFLDQPQLEAAARDVQDFCDADDLDAASNLLPQIVALVDDLQAYVEQARVLLRSRAASPSSPDAQGL